MNDITPLDSFNRILRYWWIVALSMILCGLFGWALSFLFQPVYEANAIYNVQLDEETVLKIAREENPEAELDFLTRNKYLAPVELIFYEPETRADLAEMAQAEGLDYAPSDFNVNDFNIDRRSWDWTIIVRSNNPQTAARLANLWMQVSDDRLQLLRQKSIKALGLEIQIKTLTACFDGRPLAEANQCAGTSLASIEEVANLLDSFDKQAQLLRRESLGINELTTLSPVSEAGIPGRPVLYGTGLLAFIGSLIGLIVGGMLIQRFPIKVG
jgi:hypothetical protein